jgi:hypothetical protein
MRTKLSFLMLFALLASGVAAAEAKPAPACHGLMTEKECSDHETKLAALQAGEVRDRYLEEYARVQRERQLACNCQHTPAGWARMPKQRQAMLRY